MKTVTSTTKSSGNDRGETATRTLHQILISNDSIGALEPMLAEFSNALQPAILAVYRVAPLRLPGESLSLKFDCDLTPKPSTNSHSDLLDPDALDEWSEELCEGKRVLTSVENLPRATRSRFEEVGYRSLWASFIIVDHGLTSVLVCASDAEVGNWATEKRILCEEALNVIGLALLCERSRNYSRLNAVLAYSFDFLSVFGPDGTVILNAPTFSRVLGDVTEEPVGESIFDTVHPDDQQRVAAALQQLLEEPGGQRRIEMRLKHGDGTWRFFEALGTNQIDNPLIGGIVATAYDVTDRKELEERLSWQALHDPLTNLANRALLLNDLNRSLARAQRSGGMVALFYLDLDMFKVVNDTFGHRAGDQLLVAIAERIQACVRAGETVARQGGDEFIVVLEGLETKEGVERAASRILDAVHLPVQLSHGTVSTTASMGISITSGETIDADDLLIQADTALYAAKRAGRARYRFYDADHQNDLPMIDAETSPCLS